MRFVNVVSGDGESVMVYSGDGRIVLQVRRVVHGQDDPLAASFKSGVLLDKVAALRVASELLRAVVEVEGVAALRVASELVRAVVESRARA